MNTEQIIRFAQTVSRIDPDVPLSLMMFNVPIHVSYYIIRVRVRVITSREFYVSDMIFRA